MDWPGTTPSTSAEPVHLDELGWIDPLSLDFEDPEHPDTSSALAACYHKTPTGRWSTRHVIKLTAEQAREVLASAANAALADDDKGK